MVTALGGLAGGALNPIIGAVSYERVPTELRARVLPAINSLTWAGIPCLGARAASPSRSRAPVAKSF